MLDHNKDLSIFGGTFTDNRIVNLNTSSHTTCIGAKGGFDRLEEQVAHKAFHNSSERFDAPKCHPRTRVAVLERIMEWVWGREDRDALIMWLYGPAGAGKSSIAQSIAEKCHELGLLLATFFFSKSDGFRNNSQHLIPTLAYQVASYIPETREPIVAAILNDTLIFTKSLSTQVELLLIKPLRPLMDSGYFNDPNARRLIIIDGLDECRDPKVQQNIVQQISNTLEARNVPLIFLVASRPEVHLSITFNLPAQTPILTRLALDDQYQPEEDIRIYLENSFEQIRSTHPRKDFFPSSWPSPDQVKVLVYKASGQFIYAATVVKYVQSLQHSPLSRLEVILGLHPPHNDRPFAELDALYKEIFLALDEPRPVLQILGLMNIQPLQHWTFFYFFSPVDWTSGLLSLKPSDIFGYMSNISALVTLKTDPNTKYTSIEIHHNSLIEFLEDPSRAGMFYLDPRISTAQVVHRYLQIIEDEKITDDCMLQNPEHLRLLPWSLEQHCRTACMTEELQEALKHLSVPKFIDFFLWQPRFGGLDCACEVLEALKKLSQDGNNIQDHQPSLQKHLLNLLEPYFSHPRLTSLCILTVDPWDMCSSQTSTPDSPILSELLQLNKSLHIIDNTRFWFNWAPLELARSRCQRLKSILLSSVTESRGAILATLALHLLEYLCNHRRVPQDAQLRKSNYNPHMIRNAPWRWRQRFTVIKPFWSKFDKVRHDARPEVPRWCLGILRCRRPYMVYRRELSLINFAYALDRLPVFLKHAEENDDLIVFASRHIVSQHAFRFPRPKASTESNQSLPCQVPGQSSSNPPPGIFWRRAPRQAVGTQARQSLAQDL